MESTDKKYQGTCQDIKRSSNLAIINRLPDEVLLEIFDFCRQSTYKHWKEKHAWFNLAHVCRWWRTVMFASSSRLDLKIIVGPVKPRHIKTILSGHWPISINYSHFYGPREDTGSALWRMYAVLKRRDRVREISFGGFQCSPIFRKFIKATNYHFPALESLDLHIPRGYEHDIPATFLRGPDQSDLPLRRLRLCGGSPAFVFRLLSSTTAFTDLTLDVTSDDAILDLSRGSPLLACLQGMRCLRSLDLTTPDEFEDSPYEFQHSPVPKNTTVPMSSLKRFRYSGHTSFLNHLMFGISAPSLQDAHFELFNEFPLMFLSRLIDDVREDFRSVSVAFDQDYFLLLSSTHSGEIDHLKPSSFRFDMIYTPNSSMRSTPSAKLAMAEELTLNFTTSDILEEWENSSSMRDFLRQFRNVRMLRVNPFVEEIGLYLKQDEVGKEAIFPVLEQVEISISRGGCPDKEYQPRVDEALAAFEPCERAGRPVKVYCCEQTEMQFRNASQDAI